MSVAKKATTSTKPLSSRRRHAVAIANAVLKWLRTKKLVVKRGAYCQFSPSEVKVTQDISLQKALPALVTPTAPCQVCAKGALFIAAVDLYNKVDINPEQHQFGLFESHTIKPLLPYFSNKTLSRIEYAFDRGWVGKGSNADSVFGERYPDPRARLRAIMKNIIKHNGDFVTKGRS